MICIVHPSSPTISSSVSVVSCVAIVRKLGIVRMRFLYARKGVTICVRKDWSEDSCRGPASRSRMNGQVATALHELLENFDTKSDA